MDDLPKLIKQASFGAKGLFCLSCPKNQGVGPRDIVTTIRKAQKMWHIILTTGVNQAEKYAEALEPVCDAVAWIDTDEDGIVEVEGICEQKPDAKIIAEVFKNCGQAVPKYKIEKLPDTDWLKMSYQAFPSTKLGRYWIHGSHITDAPPAGSWPLQIDAATAFGSGQHPTTAGCLVALERLSKRVRKPKRTLDMGTGSGILAVGAARAFRKPIYAVDIDPESIRVTDNHARANGVRKMMKLQAGNGFKAPLARSHAPYNLLLANILAKPLCKMSALGAKQVKQGGDIVLAGLLHHQAPAVVNFWRMQGAHLVRKDKRGEWTILTLRKGRV